MWANYIDIYTILYFHQLLYIVTINIFFICLQALIFVFVFFFKLRASFCNRTWINGWIVVDWGAVSSLWALETLKCLIKIIHMQRLFKKSIRLHVHCQIRNQNQTLRIYVLYNWECNGSIRWKTVHLIW